MTHNAETEDERRLFLRLSPEIRRKVEPMAKKDRRSLQSQAEFLIEEGIRAQQAATE